MSFKVNIVPLVKQLRYMQYLSAVLASLSFASASMYLVWPSPALPQLTSKESPIGIQLTVEEASWIASSTSLGIMSTGCIKIFCGDSVGRRTWLLISGGFLIVPWIIIYFMKSIIMLYIARFVGGLGLGIVYTTASIYIAEMTEKDIRGKLSTLVAISSLCANLFILTVGPFISYFNLALFCCILPIVFVGLFYFMPESPYYLVMIGQRDSALATLKLISSRNADSTFVQNRLDEIEETVTYEMNNKGSIWECISKRDYRKPLVIMLGMKTLYQLSGLHVIDSYAQTIITRTDSSISSEMSSILFGVIQVPAAIAFSLLVDKVGRKPLGIISSAGCAVALFGEGLCFYLDNIDSIAWLPTTCIVLFYIMAPIGITVLPHILLGEVFPTNIKGAAVSLLIIYSSLLHFIAIKYFEPFSIEYGMHVTFWIFGIVCVLGILFILVIVPETKGKTLKEIQEILNKNMKKEPCVEAIK